MIDEKIIVAVDETDLGQTLQIINSLKDYTKNFKLPLSLFLRYGAEMLRHYWNRDLKLILDIKIHDIPQVAAQIAREICRQDLFAGFTVHCAGEWAMMKKVVETARQFDQAIRPKVIGVTFLSSLNQRALSVEEEMVLHGVVYSHDGRNLKEELLRNLVVRRAQRAQAAGCDGVVASGYEVKAIKGACGADFPVYVPGIRPQWADKQDQKRVVTPAQAIENGADYLIIGRPITHPPASIRSPLRAIQKIDEEIRSVVI